MRLLLINRYYLRCLLLAFLCIPVCATVNVRDYGAQGDGIANDTAALNSASRAACAASEDVHIPAGTYLVNSLATLKGCGITFYGDGASSTILKLLRAARPSMWTFDGSPGRTMALAIRDLALDGGHLGGAGIAIEQYQAVTINNVFAHDFGTPGYGLGHKKDFDGLYIRNVENVRIMDSQFTGNERYGVELQAVHSSTVRNSTMSFNGGMGGVSEQNFEGALDGPLVAQWLDNKLEGNGSGGIDVETDEKLPPARGILQGNRVINCGNDNWDSGWGLVIGLNAFGTIEGNWVENFAAYAATGGYSNAIAYGRNGGPIRIVNNTIIRTKSRGIIGNEGIFPVTITGNTLTDNGTGIYIYKSPRVEITNNRVTDNSGYGIDVFWSRGSTITGNQLARNFRDLRINGRVEIQR
jgi:parallel beta-helix repeat protein